MYASKQKDQQQHQQQHQQQPRQQFVMKEEDGRLSTSVSDEQQQQHIVMNLGMFDVSVSLVDCLKKGTLMIPNLAEPVTQSKSACNISETSTEKSNPKDGQNIQLQSSVHKNSCTYCDYKTSQKGHLTEHVRTHTGEKPFACDVCDYKFSQKSRLTEHLRTHTGEKLFACDVCDYKCPQKSDLTKHMSTHTGEKPNTCNICDFKCSDQSSLIRHMSSKTMGIYRSLFYQKFFKRSYPGNLEVWE